MIENSKAIGVLDSGVGGLGIVKYLKELLPGENILYYADTAHMPYGSKSASEVKNLATNGMKYLCAKHELKLLIVACNTATVAGLECYRKHFPMPVIGVVKPGVKAAVSITKNKKIGLIATVGTVNSNTYPKLMVELDPSIKVYQMPCPKLAGIVENQDFNQDVISIAKSYLYPLLNNEIDSLILGCTHYPSLYHIIRPIVGKSMNVIDPSFFTVREVYDFLTQSLGRNPQREGYQIFYVSGQSWKFYQIAQKLLGYPINISSIRQTTSDFALSL
ncbi:MAG: glutamate racemase [Firmicutes bacterium]|nr:glutamate racemase [Bacillota bacterium]